MSDPLPEILERALASALAPGERVFVKLKGTFKEALVCTDMRVMILKAGWVTGNLFGTNTFQCPYPNVAGAQVRFNLITGYFELSAGGMQNTPKSFWKNDSNVNAAKALNCVSLNSREQAGRFQQACAFIMSRAAGEWPIPRRAGPGLA